MADERIDGAWLSQQTNPDGPYYLRKADTTYTLEQDIAVPGTAFVVLANNVTLDLNGHTVTYGNTPLIEVPNGGFESNIDDAGGTGWTFSDRQAVSHVPVRYGMFGERMLRVGPTSAAQSMTSGVITLHTLNVEHAAIISCKGTSGTTVRLSVIDPVTGIALSSATSANVDRGFAPVVRFTPKVYQVQLRVEVIPPTGKAVTVDLDQATVRRSRDYGIVASKSVWNYPGHLRNPLVDGQARYAANFKAINGQIVQGTGESVGGSAFYVQSLGGFQLYNIVARCNGDDTSHIMGQYAAHVWIEDCTFVGDIARITNRMLQFAAISLSSAGGAVLLLSNRIHGSMHCGIVVTGNGMAGNTTTIVDNIIRHTALGTDGYGILVNNLRNFRISSNTVEPVNGRGLLLDGYNNGTTADGTIEQNKLTAFEQANLEYPATSLEATAFRMRNYGSSAFCNITIRHNRFKASTAAGAAWACAGARITLDNARGQLNDSGILFDSNTFEAELLNVDPTLTGARAPRAWGLSLSGVQPGTGVQFVSNNYVSNDRAVNLGDNDSYNGKVEGVSFDGAYFYRKGTDIPVPFKAIAVGDWANTVSNVTFVRAVEDDVNAPSIVWLGSKAKSLTFEAQRIVHVTCNGLGIGNVPITITDEQGTTVETVTTNVDGKATVKTGTVQYSVAANSSAVVATGSTKMRATVTLTGSTDVSEGDVPLELAVG